MPRRLSLLLAVLLFTGCGGPLVQERDGYPDRPVDVSQVKDAIPRNEPRSRYGNPPSYVVNGKRYHVQASAEGYVATGTASWYGTKFHGRRTSSGEVYDMYGMTAAHRTLPLPTYARVTNLDNGRSVVVKINDRGPFHSERIVDLSYAAASKLGILGRGTGRVEVRAITPGRDPAPTLLQAGTGGTAQSAAARPAVATAAVSGSDATPGRYFLQVGAFASRDNAENLRTRLTNLAGHPVIITPSSNAETTLYRVRIGPVGSVAEADGLANRLSGQGVTTHQIVAD